MNKNVYVLTSCALMAAILCIVGPMSIPIGAVPVSLATFIIYLSAFVLGSKGSSVSVLVYILLGVAGLPVFSGGQGGPAKVLGPTGGYIAGYILLAFISGYVIERSKNNLVISFVGMVIATIVLYAFGTVWFVIQAKTSLAYALSVCVVPFVVFDIIKIIVAESVGFPIRSALLKSGLLMREKSN
ncbi:MAG: biotin transporter BioY [Lachnospiraceae bacterium]|nr:biotin transporter BioY [Lachnospiraceae bacterium]